MVGSTAYMDDYAYEVVGGICVRAVLYRVAQLELKGEDDPKH